MKIALNSFGGPAGQIAVMHRVLVDEKRWISEERFLHALNYCMLLPGPEATQLITYIAWLLHKTPGGLVAGTLFVLPGFLSILALSILYAGFQNTGFVQAFFFGLKPAVMAIVVEAVIRIGRRALKNEVMVILAALAFVAIFFFDVPFPLIVFSAGVIGFWGGRVWTEKFYVIKGPQAQSGDQSTRRAVVIDDDFAVHTRPSIAHALRTATLWLLLWFSPVLLLAAIFGRDSIYVTEGTFFSKAAVVTFGGAYSVLAYIAQQAVNTYGWLKPGEMLDGLGMCETTPGPLIQVVQFVGFIGAYRNPGALHPVAAGILGSLITTWVTYTPCFLWIFLGAPYVERLRENKSLSSALSAITAVVVGVVLNLAVWFSIHTLFGTVKEVHMFGVSVPVPEWQTVDIASVLIAIGAFVAISRYKLGMIPTLLGSAVVGLLYHLFFRG